MKTRFFLVYRKESGRICYVAKGDEEKIITPDSLLPDQDFLPLDDHPDRESIFANPGEYIVDLAEGKVRRQTAEEKEREYEEYKRRVGEASELQR